MKPALRISYALAAIAAASAIGLSACSDDKDSDKAKLPSVTITAQSTAYEAPDTFPAGLVSVTMRNADGAPHGAQFARLNEGVTTEKLISTLQSNPDEALPMVSLAGGIPGIAPGKSQNLVLDLKAGQYLMLDFASGDDGVPNFAKGVIKPFRVEGAASKDAKAPKTDGEVVLNEFNFKVPTVKAGAHTYKISNAGKQAHEMVLVKLSPGTTIADLQKLATNPESMDGPPPFEEAGGFQAIDGGGQAWMTLDLTPGDYAVLCFLPDPNSGKPHVELGMISPLTVK